MCEAAVPPLPPTAIEHRRQPVKRTRSEVRADIAQAVRRRLHELQEHHTSGRAELDARILRLEATLASMSGRHTLHARNELRDQIAALQREAQELDTGEELVSFERAAVEFLSVRQKLEQEELEQETRRLEKPTVLLAKPTLILPQILPQHNARRIENHAAGATFEAGTAAAKSFETETETEAANALETAVVVPRSYADSNADKGVPLGHADKDVPLGHAVPNVVRRRYVARPETRTVTGACMNLVIATDEFLEKNVGINKPVCLQSCDQCFLCGGALVMDVQSDVMVCDICRAEQMVSADGSDAGDIGGNGIDVNLCASKSRRRVHMMTHIQRHEGCTGSEKITPALLACVMQWMANRDVQLHRVSNPVVEKALRDMRMSDMVPFKTAITFLITHEEPPSFTPEQRSMLMRMFDDVSNAFELVKERGDFGDRINFLSYQYVLYKMLGLLDWGGPFQSHFKIIKGGDNLRRQDVLWKALCEEAGLYFMSTV